jgi:hypothetical protein
MEESVSQGENQELKTSDYLYELPNSVKKEITSHILALIHRGIIESFDPKNYC